MSSLDGRLGSWVATSKEREIGLEGTYLIEINLVLLIRSELTAFTRAAVQLSSTQASSQQYQTAVFYNAGRAPAARIRVVGEWCVANTSERWVRQSQNYQQEAEEGGDRADSIGFIEASEECLLASLQNGMFSIALPSRATPLDCSFLSRVRCQIREKIW
jgi:hypothetical protein